MLIGLTRILYHIKGSCCIMDKNGEWFVGLEIPIFKNDGRNYIERLISIDKE